MSCLFEKQIPDYLAGELQEKQLAEFEQHLSDCNYCSNELESLSAVHTALENYERPEPDKELVKAYKNELLDLFPKESKISSWQKAFSNFWESAFAPRPVVLRFAQAAVILLFGIFLGRSLLREQPEGNVALVPAQLAATQVSSTINNKLLNDFFVESEILLLGLDNYSAVEIETEMVEINKEMAQRLLVQTSQLQQAANQFNDESVIGYLTKLELLLLELSNVDDANIIQAFTDVRNIVKETDLLQASKEAQDKMTQSILADI
jgi:hypothetical protein